ncbi:MAG: hypothetical protein ACR2FY_15705 [Pirellulaceae bacterium]
MAKAEHRVEECLQRCKSEAGLGDYEVRNWVGWQHHQTLSLVATWFHSASAVPLPVRGCENSKEQPADIARRAAANPGETSTDGPFRRRR